MNCGECQKPISCGCQKVTASNNLPVHKGCLENYERKINPGVVRRSNTVFPKSMEIVIPPVTIKTL